MTPKQLLRIAVALGALLVLWGLTQLFGHKTDTTAARFDLPKLNAADVDTVKIFRPADTLVVVRGAGDAWTVNGFRASTQSVTDLFAALKDSSLADLVAESPTSHPQLGVDSATGKRLEMIKGGKALLSLVVGTHGPGFEGVYVRRPTEATVYLIHAGLASPLERQLDDWRDKEIVAVNPDSVREVRVQQKRGAYDLRLSGGGWRFAAGAKADSGAVRRMLEQYRNFQAGGFPTKAQEDSIHFTRPTRRLTLVGRSAPLADLMFDSTSSWWWVRKAEGGTVYRLESWRLNQLFPADSMLRAKPDTAKKAAPAAGNKAKPDTTKGPGK
jgi:hypothetical protein